MFGKQDIMSSVGLLILRLGVGGMMMTHGYDKLINYADKVEKFPDPLGIGSQMSLISTIGTEFVCSIFIILGLATPLFAIPLAFTMFIACFVIHAQDDFATKEKAALYLTTYLTLIFTGGGRFSLYPLVAKLFRRKKSDES